MIYVTYSKAGRDIVYSPSKMFELAYEMKWMKDETVIRIIETIDGIKHIDGNVFEHPYHGEMSVYDISGVKCYNKVVTGAE